MIDFVELDMTDLAESGVWNDVIDPRTRTVIPDAQILIASYVSEHAKEAKRKLQKSRAKLGRPVTPEEIEEDALAIVMSVVLNWRGIAWKGETLACTAQNKRMLLGRLDWLRQFVDDKASETAAFFPPSASSSPSTSSTSSGLASGQPAQS